MHNLIYHTQIVVQKDGTLTLRDLPLKGGQRVEVVIFQADPQSDSEENPLVLRSEPLKDVDPFSAVALDDWEALS